jgi:tRNA threonylcarbamoyladenosine biosynthesis protein TsaE
MRTLISASVHSLPELRKFASEVQSVLPPQAVVLLSGDLGAGKTTFVSFFCEELGIRNVQSPTYSIHNRYPGIDHFDLYRLETRDQLESSGIFDLLEESRGVCFIEWPERLKEGDLSPGRKIFEVRFLIKDKGREVILRALN